MYDAEYTRKFYNAYGDFEWQRLEATPYGRLQAIIHEDFLQRYLKKGDCVLDAGSGPGRFSIVAAKAGAKVTVLDISDKQLETARQKISEAGLEDHIDDFIRADICDLSIFKDGQFDVVMCFGGALSYACENRQKAAGELIRVVKPGGVILVSVMSRLGPIQGVARMPDMVSLQDPDRPTSMGSAIWGVLETGDLEFYSPRLKMMHAPMHLYTAKELAQLFKACKLLEIAGSNVTIPEAPGSGKEIAASSKTWSTLVEMEKRINHEPGLVDTGSHIILAVKNQGKVDRKI